MSRRGKQLMSQINLGKIPSTGYISNIKPVSDRELQEFVENEIKDGPQIVSIPMPPYRHVFLVDVQLDKIMISDWKGIKSVENQYFCLIKLLEQKYYRKIEYYPVDKKLYADAKIHNDNSGGGGCAYYIFSWTKLNYDNYQI
jgi:hypothetical protein